MKKAFIVGIAGQDGSYLAESLLEKGYEVSGIIRRNSTVEHQRNRISHLGDIQLEYGDLNDPTSLDRALRLFRPTEIYNLGAQSHVRISFDVPQFTTQVNSLGVLNLLEAYRQLAPDAKFYQASSSEMFGNSIDEDLFQRITTPMNPVSPYGCSKLYGFHMVKLYRNSYGLNANNGILFNHESPRRGSNFVTNKVVKTAVQIKLGISEILELGNLDSHRDWGHSWDYVRAMQLIMDQDTPDDWIVSTGETRSVRQLCEYVFGQLGLSYEDFVTQNPKYLRPNELDYLRGDSSRIRNELGWKPKYTFEAMMDEMIEHWQSYFENGGEA
jgi:GDPmannose 4,6-dehydratase